MTTGFSLHWAARCKGVQPSSVCAIGSAPAAMRALIMSGLSLLWAATCKGVHPSSACVIGSAARSDESLDNVRVIVALGRHMQRSPSIFGLCHRIGSRSDESLDYGRVAVALGRHMQEGIPVLSHVNRGL